MERSWQEIRTEIGEELSGDKAGLERSCQEIRSEIGEELLGDKTGDLKGAARR